MFQYLFHVGCPSSSSLSLSIFTQVFLGCFYRCFDKQYESQAIDRLLPKIIGHYQWPLSGLCLNGVFLSTWLFAIKVRMKWHGAIRYSFSALLHPHCRRYASRWSFDSGCSSRKNSSSRNDVGNIVRERVPVHASKQRRCHWRFFIVCCRSNSWTDGQYASSYCSVHCLKHLITDLL